MTISFKRQTTVQTWGGSAVFTPATATTAGDTLVCYVGSNTGNNISDSAGNTWEFIGDTTSAGATGQRVGQMWVCRNAASVTTVTVTHGGANKAFSGSLVELESDDEVLLTDSGVNRAAAVTVDTTTDGFVLVAAMWYLGTPVDPSGYTALTATVQSGFNVSSSYKTPTVAGTEAPYYSGVSSNDVGIITISLSEDEPVEPPPVEPSLTWTGTGLTAGNLTTSSAAGDDTPPSTVNGPTGKLKIESSGARPPRITVDDQVSTTGANAGWLVPGGDITTYAVRVYFSYDSSNAASGVPAIQGGPAGGGVSWRLDLSPGGEIRFRGADAAAIHSPSFVLPASTVLRFEVSVVNGTLAFYVYEGESLTPIYSQGGLTVGTNFGLLVLGQGSGTTHLQGLTFDDVYVHPSADLIGPAGTPTTEATWYLVTGAGTSTELGNPVVVT